MNPCTCIDGCYDPFCAFDIYGSLESLDADCLAQTQAEGYKELGIALDCLDAAIRLEKGARK